MTNTPKLGWRCTWALIDAGYEAHEIVALERGLAVGGDMAQRTIDRVREAFESQNRRAA